MSDSIALRSGPYHFCQQLFELGVVEHRFRQRLLQLAVLVFQHPQPLGFGYCHAAVTWTSSCKASLRKCRVDRLRPSLLLAQNRNNLLLREPATLDCPSLPAGPDSNPPWRKNSVAGHST
jgi:hypothetical protein